MPEYFHSRMAELIVKYLTDNDNLSEEERNELKNLIESSPEKRKLFERLTDENYYLPEVLSLGKGDVYSSWKELKLTLDLVPDKIPVWRRVATAIRHIPAAVRHMPAVAKYSAAAACFFGLIFLGKKIFFPENMSNKVAAEQKKQVLILDNLPDGIVGFMGFEPIIKKDSVIVFPRYVIYGITYMMKTLDQTNFKCKLPDGSEVCLVAASTLTLDNEYGLGQRFVELDGGAFFDVARDTTKRFIVKVKGANMEVLGTRFNVLAYKNRAVVKINLFEGKLKVNAGNKTALLYPGQQAIVAKQQIKSNKTITVNNTAYGFQGSLFNFFNQDVSTVYEEIADAFGYRIRYKSPVSPASFGGMLIRDRIAIVLEKVKSTTEINYTINEKDKLITINP